MSNKSLVVKLAKHAEQRKEDIGSDPIKKAYMLAEKEFNPKTKKGRELLEHSVRVAEDLFDHGFDNTTVAAGMAHDLIAIAGASQETVSRETGEEVASIVSDYAKLREIELRNIGKISDETLSTILLATAKDLRTVFIRVVSGIDILQKYRGLGKDVVEARAKGAIGIYAPVCQKLGLYELEGLLEDGSLKIMQPKLFYSISSMLKKTRPERESEVEAAVAEFTGLIEKEKKKASVQGRAKSIYSVYRKMQQGKSFEEIFDLIGVRFICDSVRECYELLGIIHSEYKTVPDQFNDYIANPKKNGYRSIHTAILWKGKPLEVQLRTWEMHYECETGLAAHWQYKHYAKDKFFDKRLSWAKQLVEWHRSARGQQNLAHSLKMGFEQNRIFVFTPKKQVVVLPEGGTPIDFAFAIHSDLGFKCMKAKVNGKIEALSHKLENGDEVEIIPSKQAGVKRQWLGFAKSHKAQIKIRQKLGIAVVPKTKKGDEKKQKPLTSDRNTRIAKCCNPVPGDGITGIRTTKRKISVHRSECSNAASIPAKRKVDVAWGLAEKDYVVGISVKARDGPGLLPAILNILSRGNATIASTTAKTGKGNILQCRFNVKIKNLDQFDGLIKRISQLPEVFETKRE